MKNLKYLVITAILLSTLTSCLVVRDRPGYYRHHHHHHHGYRYHR